MHLSATDEEVFFQPNLVSKLIFYTHHLGKFAVHHRQVQRGLEATSDFHAACREVNGDISAHFATSSTFEVESKRLKCTQVNHAS